MDTIRRFDNSHSDFGHLANRDTLTTTQPPNPFSTIDGQDSVLLKQQVSRIISAFQSTTLFTSITPRQTAQVASSAADSETTASQDSVGASTPDFQRLVNFGVAFIIIVAVVIIAISIYLCRARGVCLRLRKKKQNQGPNTINYKTWQYVDVQAPGAARLAQPNPNRPPMTGSEFGQNMVDSAGPQPPAYSAGSAHPSVGHPRWG